MSNLEHYCQLTYGCKPADLATNELWQVVDHLGPFVCGGPHRKASPLAKAMQDKALTILRDRRLAEHS